MRGLKIDDGFLPPLPDEVRLPSEEVGAPAVLPRWGCYLLVVRPLERRNHDFQGTLRVDRYERSLRVSGDLYQRYRRSAGGDANEANPAGGIPVFRRSDYRYYLRLLSVEIESHGPSRLKLEPHALDRKSRAWTKEEPVFAVLTPSTAPSTYPGGAPFHAGTLEDGEGTTLATLTLGWVSRRVRRAVIEVDAVEGIDLVTGGGSVPWHWTNVFHDVGWDVRYEKSDRDIRRPSSPDGAWQARELHQALGRRDTSDLDREWRYHLLCVKALEKGWRGYMYDADADDTGSNAREGAAVATNVEDAQAIFRTAVHEIGHAMGLAHNPVNGGFMAQTASYADKPGVFPKNIEWRFAPDDELRLRHRPDPFVRPGGLPVAGVQPSDAELCEVPEGLELTVTTPEEPVPLAAPVRLSLRLENRSERPIDVPDGFGLMTGEVTGEVEGPGRVPMPFTSIAACLGHAKLRQLGPGKVATGKDLALLRGPKGSLFPVPGAYRVIVRLRWTARGRTYSLTRDTRVSVASPAKSEEAVAMKILSSPDFFTDSFLGLQPGPISDLIRDTVLWPYYATILTKGAVSRRDVQQLVSWARVKVDGEIVASEREVARIRELAKQAGTKVRHAVDELLGNRTDEASSEAEN